VRGRIAVGVLVEAGLSGLPECVVGVGFRHPDVAVLCRRHVTGPALTALGARPQHQAVLLIGGPDQATGLARWCTVCRRPAPAAGPVDRELVSAGRRP
jgi:hypothetical protein